MFDEVVESMVELSPRASERAALGEVRRQDGVKERETRSEDSGVGLGEEDDTRRPSGVSW